MEISFTLPQHIVLLQDTSSDVSIGDNLYKIKNRKQIKVDVASSLHIDPSDIFCHLVKVIGDSVDEGAVIAEKKGVLRKNQVKSPIKGIIENIDHSTGELIITHASTKSSQVKKSFFHGKIVSYDETESILKVHIKGKGNIYEADTISLDSGGEAFYLKDEKLYYSTAGDDINGKIIVIDEIKPYMETKFDTLDAGGIVHAKGASLLSIPSASLKNPDDITTIFKEELAFVCSSSLDKKIIFYS